MISNVWNVLCRHYVESKKTNNASLIESLQQVEVVIPPDVDDINFSFEHTLATCWFNDDEENTGEGLFKISILTPPGKTLNVAEMELSIPPSNFKFMFLNFKAMRLLGAGLYYYKVHLKEPNNKRWRLVATIPLRLKYKVHEDAPVIPIPESPIPDAQLSI